MRVGTRGAVGGGIALATVTSAPATATPRIPTTTVPAYTPLLHPVPCGSDYRHATQVSPAPDGSTWAIYGSGSPALAKSLDGGASWTYTCPAAPDLTFWRIVAFDVNRAAAIAEKDWRSEARFVLVTTDDGGRTWTEARGAYEGTVGLEFVDASSGWALGGYGTNGPALFRTTDGGHSWTAIPVAIAEARNIRSLSFVDADHGWMAVNKTGHELYATDDGGRTWRGVATPEGWISRHVLATSTDAVYFSATKNLPNGWYTSGLISTQDGGRTWSVYDTGEQSGGHLVASGRRVVAAESAVFVTSDAGQTWRKAFEPTDRFDSVTALGDEAWAAGYQTPAARSDDGGQTWATQQLPHS